MGRPKANIDWDKVIELLRADCNGVAIATLLGIHPNTLYESCKELHKCNFSEFSAIKKAEGIALVEASIFKDAMEKGGADRIFWLKNKAGWKDKQETEHTGGIVLHYDRQDSKL